LFSVYPGKARFTFSLTLGMSWDGDYENKTSAKYKLLEMKLVKSVSTL